MATRRNPPVGRGKVSTQRIKQFSKKYAELEEKLGKKDAKIFQENPHLRQVYAEGKKPEVRGFVTAEDRVLSASMPTREYTDIDRPKTVEHLGQRKLLLSEIEFLTHNYQPGDVVVYAGSAPGTHLPLLSEMFEGIAFVLYDPHRFDGKVRSLNAKVYQEYFTDKVARKLKQEIPAGKLLFISDIRTEPTDEGVVRDMRMQEKWIELMTPRKSLLKFRLPYGSGKLNYLEGKVWLQCFAPQTSTETRLEVSENPKTIEYDNKTYEDQMFYFNTVKRTMYYKHLHRKLGYDHCFDCASEIYILKEYIAKHKKFTVKDLKDKIDAMLVPLFHSFA